MSPSPNARSSLALSTPERELCFACSSLCRRQGAETPNHRRTARHLSSPPPSSTLDVHLDPVPLHPNQPYPALVPSSRISSALPTSFIFAPPCCNCFRSLASGASTSRPLPLPPPRRHAPPLIRHHVLEFHEHRAEGPTTDRSYARPQPL